MTVTSSLWYSVVLDGAHVLMAAVAGDSWLNAREALKQRYLSNEEQEKVQMW